MKFLDSSADATFQFCVRDSATSRQDLEAACQTLQQSLSSGAAAPLAVLMLGSMERGNRVFRYQHWESSQVNNVLRSVQQQRGQAQQQQQQLLPPVCGMYSAGSFTSQKIRIDAAAVSMGAPALMYVTGWCASSLFLFVFFLFCCVRMNILNSELPSSVCVRVKQGS